MTDEKQKRPSWVASLIPFAVLVLMLVFVIRSFGASAMDGGSQVSLLFAAGVAVATAMLGYGIKWKTLESSIADNFKSIGPAIIILILIGAISGSWMVSGVVPTLIYYGMKVITPKIFLFAACVICALVSVITGSSWTTIATLGLALLGIGKAQGYETGWIAGAIISGAYFGDKISPLSDTTVLAASSAGTPLFTHIRYMMITTVPSFVIASVIFLIASLNHQVADSSGAEEISLALRDSFTISPWLLLIPVLTAVMIARRLPALLTLFVSALMAGLCALVVQPDIIYNVATGSDLPLGSRLPLRQGFEGLMISYYDSTSLQTGNAMLDDLVSTRGMNGMLGTIFLIISAAAFGGVMTGSGMIQSITDVLTKRIKSRTGTVASTVLTGLGANMVTGDQYLSIILTCSLYKKLFRDNGFEERLLSRTTEDSVTVTSVLIPWNSCGMTQATVLKVPTLDYLPYCFFNILSPLMSIFIAATGYKIIRHTTQNSSDRTQ